MLSVAAPFPYPGSNAYLDDRDVHGRDVVEPVRILRDNGDGSVLISLKSHRYPHEIASGNRSVPLSSLRETVQPLRPVKPSGRTKGRRR